MDFDLHYKKLIIICLVIAIGLGLGIIIGYITGIAYSVIG
jgi:hypothetical protein